MPFYMDRFANFVKAHGEANDQTYGFLRHVMVKEYNPETNRVKVAHYDTATGEFSLITSWYPWFTTMNGQGTNAETGKLNGHVFTPCIGERAFLLPFAGDHNDGLVIGGIYTDKRPPPSPEGKFTKAGEWTYMHHSGSYLKFFDNGDVTIYSAGNLNFHSDGGLNAHVIKDVTVGAERNVAITGTSIALNANGQVMSNAPQTSTSQNLSAGNGASGTFTSVTGQVITVHNGIITNIF